MQENREYGNIALLIEYKLKEFHNLGYVNITYDDVEEFIKKFKIRYKEVNYLHQLTTEIMSSTISEYMDYERVKAIKSSDQIEDYQELFRS